MKLFLTTVVVVLAVGIVALLLWFFLKPAPQKPPPTNTNPFPIATSTTSTPIPNNPQVTEALSPSLPDTHFNFSGTVTVMPYALQNWGDENAGSEALLKYATTSGWTVLSTGGGAWDVPSLEKYGVPADVAAQLIAGEN